MNIATLGVAIDPTKAQQGSAEAVKAMDAMEKKAASTAAAMKRESDAAGSSAAKAADGHVQANASAWQRMLASVRNFFSGTQAEAGKTTGAFREMVSSAVGFLTNLLSFIPGTAGLFAQMASGAAGAATSVAGLAAAGGPLLVVLGALAAVLVVVTAAMVALGAAAVLTWKAIGSAAEMQTIREQYTVLIGDTEKAKAALLDLREFADKTPFDTKQVMQFGQQLLNAGRDVEDLKSELQVLGDASFGSFEKMQTAVLVYTQAIGKGKVDTMDLRQLGNAGIPIIEGLSRALGKTSGEIFAMAEAGRIGFTELKAGFEGIAGAGGRLNGMMDRMSRTWNGLMSTLASDWDNVKTAFGTPILESLTPLLARFEKWVAGLEPAAARAGAAVADVLNAFQQMLEQGTLQEAFWLKFRIEGRKALAEMFSFGPNVLMGIPDLVQSLTSKYGFLGQISRAVEAIALGLVDNLLFGFRQIVAVFDAGFEVAVQKIYNAVDYVRSKAPTWMGGSGQPYSPGTLTFDQAYNNRMAYYADEHLKTQLQYADQLDDALKEMGASWDTINKAVGDFGGTEDQKRFDALIAKANSAAAALRQAADQQNRLTGGHEKDNRYSPPADKGFKSDAEQIAELQRTTQVLADMQRANMISTTEMMRRQQDAEQATVKNLADPSKAQEDYPGLISKFAAYNAERARLSEEAELKIRAGAATTAEVFRHAGDSIIQKWGNMAQQMDAAVQNITQAIANDLGTALTDIVTGAKDTKDAFREMATAILKDIARIIIQMLVQLAIQTALRAMGFNYGGMAGPTSIAPVSAPTTGARGFATGGSVFGGRGGIDDIPAWLTAGEFVMPKDAVQHYGREQMEDMRHKRARRFAEGGEVAAAAGAAAPAARTAGSGGGGNISVNVNVDARGGGNTTVKADNAGDKKRGENLGRSLEAVVMQVLTREKRAGGILAR